MVLTFLIFIFTYFFLEGFSGLFGGHRENENPKYYELLRSSLSKSHSEMSFYFLMFLTKQC
jgi:hypothetical protein